MVTLREKVHIEIYAPRGIDPKFSTIGKIKRITLRGFIKRKVTDPETVEN